MSKEMARILIVIKIDLFYASQSILSLLFILFTLFIYYRSKNEEVYN